VAAESTRQALPPPTEKKHRRLLADELTRTDNNTRSAKRSRPSTSRYQSGVLFPTCHADENMLEKKVILCI